MLPNHTYVCDKLPHTNIILIIRDWYLENHSKITHVIWCISKYINFDVISMYAQNISNVFRYELHVISIIIQDLVLFLWHCVWFVMVFQNPVTYYVELVAKNFKENTCVQIEISFE